MLHVSILGKSENFRGPLKTILGTFQKQLVLWETPGVNLIDTEAHGQIRIWPRYWLPDVLEHSRVSQIMYKLKPRWDQIEQSKLGFPIFHSEGHQAAVHGMSQLAKQRAYTKSGTAA